METSLKEKPNILLDKNIYNLVAIGSLKKVKGFERLIKIQKRLIENDYNTHLYIIGEGPERINLLKLIKRLKINNKVTLIGQMNNPFMILRWADLLVLSSYYEGLGMVLIESIYCKVPFVAPKISGVLDIVNNIAPKGFALITENTEKSLYEGIVKRINTSQEIKVEIDIGRYNLNIMKKINNLFNIK